MNEFFSQESTKTPPQESDREARESFLKTRFRPLMSEDGNSFIDKEGGTRQGDQEELMYLSDEIAANDGKLILLVHPFYEDFARLPKPYVEAMKRDDNIQKRLDQCNNATEELLASEERLPVLILEDRTHTDASLNHCLNRDVPVPGEVYIMPTFESMGTPYIGNSPDEEGKTRIPGGIHPLVAEDYRKRLTERDRTLYSPLMKYVSDTYKVSTWSYLAIVLQKIGVKKVYLGGKFLDFEENDGEKSLSRCLGEAYDFLHLTQSWFKDFDVELTDVTFPLGKDQLDGIKMLADTVNPSVEKKQESN